MFEKEVKPKLIEIVTNTLLEMSILIINFNANTNDKTIAMSNGIRQIVKKEKNHPK